MLLFYIGFINAQYIMEFFSNILSILLPFILGFIVAYAVNPFVVFLEKKIPRTMAVIVVLLCFVLLFCFLIFTIFPILYQQIVSFTIQLIQIINHFSEKFQLPSGKLEVGLAKIINQVLERVGSFTTSTTFNFVGGVFRGISSFGIGAISFVYFLFYMKKIRIYFKEVFLVKYPRLYQYLHQIDKKMIQYVKGLGILMFVQFVEYSFLFFVIGHPRFLVLGIFIGLFTAAPYIGGLIANLIAILTAFMISRPLFYATLFVCLFFPLVDEYLISPKIYGQSNDIHPVLTIFLLSIGGSIGGVLGIILAIPIYLFLRTTVQFFWGDVKNSARSIKDVL